MNVTIYQDAAGAWRWYVTDGSAYESKGWAVHVATSQFPEATVHLEDRNGLTEEDD